MTARVTKYEAPKLGRVLLADDEILVCKAIQADLIKQNVDCEYFLNYADAAAAIKTGKYHAVVTDVFLSPGKADGLNLVEMARMEGIPAVVITSALDLNVAKEGLNKGADQLFEKPFAIDNLVKALSEIWESPKGLIARRERLLESHKLTEKEKEMTRLILKGLSNQEIADVTGTTLATVKFYSSQIFEKFTVKSRAELFNLVFPT